MTTLVQVGDVVKAPHGWIFAFRRSGPVRPLQVSDSASDDTIVRDVSGMPLSEYDCQDPTREGAFFVVEEAVLAGGGVGEFSTDYYPNGWRVTACRLNPDGSYNAEGERVEFYQSDGFTNISYPEVVGKMRRTFVPVE